MSYFPDMGQKSMVATGPHIRAIGWLHHEHPFPTGKVTAEFLEKLKQFAANSHASSEDLWFGVFGGFHCCDFCNKAHCIRNFGVPRDDVLFVAPEMIVHYIEQHGYKPPDEFVTALMRSPIPGSEEYSVITEPIWHLHKTAHEKARAAAFVRAGEWAAEQGGGTAEIANAAMRFFGTNSEEFCKRIRHAMIR